MPLDSSLGIIPSEWHSSESQEIDDQLTDYMTLMMLYGNARAQIKALIDAYNN